MTILRIIWQALLRFGSFLLPLANTNIGKTVIAIGITIICMVGYQKLTESGNSTKNNQRVGTGNISNNYHYYQPKSIFGCVSVPVKQYREKQIELKDKNEL